MVTSPLTVATRCKNFAIEEVGQLPHEEQVKYEQDRMARCIAYLEGMLGGISSKASA